MDILAALTAEFHLRAQQVENTVRLLDDGNTIPFIARYRKEMTGSLDDQLLRQLADRLAYLRGLDEQREKIRAVIEEQGKLSGELAAALDAAATLSELEDLYRPYRPRRRTRASMAREKGLEPLADALYAQPTDGEDPLLLAQAYTGADVQTPEDALAGARDILAERISDDANARKRLRVVMMANGFLCSKAAGEDAGVYALYADFKEPLHKVAGHRVLAVNRGEREELLKVQIAFDRGRAMKLLYDAHVREGAPAAAQVRLAAEDAYDRLLFPSLERELRAELTDRASTAAIRVFSVNLRQLLMQPPVKGRVALVLYLVYCSVFKVAVVDPTGKVLDTGVIYPAPPHKKIGEAKALLKDWVARYGIEIIAIGNDESLATGIYARKDSPILGHTGYNALYPEMAGTGGTVRGKTILCTAGSSAHYTVHKWLEALSLTEKEVTIKDMPSEEALKAFLNGEGDAVALWSPYTLEAEQHGLMPVTLSSQCDASQPTLLLANKAFAKEHPALVTAFLKIYFRGITALQETPREQLIQDYRAFYHAWTGRDLPPQDAAWELAKHPVYGLKGQLTLFDPAQKKLHTWLQELASFTGGKNRLSDVTDVYLKKLAQ